MMRIIGFVLLMFAFGNAHALEKDALKSRVSVGEWSTFFTLHDIRYYFRIDLGTQDSRGFFPYILYGEDTGVIKKHTGSRYDEEFNDRWIILHKGNPDHTNPYLMVFDLDKSNENEFLGFISDANSYVVNRVPAVYADNIRIYKKADEWRYWPKEWLDEVRRKLGE
ncbi:hypothetical protein ACFL6Y_09670 [Elusimicrobiota bacterium]